MTLPLKDLPSINEAFEDLHKEMNYLDKRFMAIAMDYNFYIGNSSNQDYIYELRDNISYRLFCANLHLELLIRQHYIIESRFERIYKEDPHKINAEVYPSNPIFDEAEKEISAIFDSLIYHLVSIFDYLGTLVNFACGEKKQETLSWTSLANSVRKEDNHFYKTSIAGLVSQIDNDFVKKLYDHRSHLIHRKAEINRSHIKYTLAEGKFNVSYVSTNSLNKQFSILKNESKEFGLTIKYVAFWLSRKSILEVSSVLLGLSKELELKRNPKHFVSGIIDETTKRLVSASEGYWYKSEYEIFKNSF